MNKPTFMQKAKGDMIFVSALIVTVLAIGLGIYFFFDETIPELAPYISLGVGVLAAIGAFFQSKNIDTYFKNNITAEAEVTAISFYKGNGTIKLRFVHDTEEVNTAVGVSRNGRTTSLRAGDSVTVLINPKKVKKVLIKDLYE